MLLTEQEIEELRNYKNVVDSDNIRFKEIIKEKLLNNQKILYALNNTNLEKINASADSYFEENIYPYYMIPDTQTNVKNFICYEVKFDETYRYNKMIKMGQIVFYILCEIKGITDALTGIARHDLLSALIIDEFNCKNYFGTQTHCISDKPSTVDAKYACRTLIFQVDSINNIVKTNNGISKVINNEVHQ